MCRRVERKVQLSRPDYPHTLFRQGHTLGVSTIQCKGDDGPWGAHIIPVSEDTQLIMKSCTHKVYLYANQTKAEHISQGVT